MTDEPKTGDTDQDATEDQGPAGLVKKTPARFQVTPRSIVIHFLEPTTSVEIPHQVIAGLYAEMERRAREAAAKAPIIVPAGAGVVS